jgi:hypothetical protein
LFEWPTTAYRHPPPGQTQWAQQLQHLFFALAFPRMCECHFGEHKASQERLLHCDEPSNENWKECRKTEGKTSRSCLGFVCCVAIFEGSADKKLCQLKIFISKFSQIVLFSVFRKKFKTLDSNE